jgi:hypothetical protein
MRFIIGSLCSKLIIYFTAPYFIMGFWVSICAVLVFELLDGFYSCSLVARKHAFIVVFSI